MTDPGLLAAMTRGIAAGAVGAAAMTLTQRLEMSVTGRDPSEVPGQVGAHLLPGRDPRSRSDVRQLNSAVHWSHGVAMGALRGLLDVAGVRGPAASAVHFALLWTGDAALYRTLGIAEAPWRWAVPALTTDVAHKAVHAAVTGAVYDLMVRSRRSG